MIIPNFAQPTKPAPGAVSKKSIDNTKNDVTAEYSQNKERNEGFDDINKNTKKNGRRVGGKKNKKNKDKKKQSNYTKKMVMNGCTNALNKSNKKS